MQWIQRIGLTAMIMLLAACSGAQPYQYTDNREQPSGPGLFSGSDGAFSTAKGDSE